MLFNVGDSVVYIGYNSDDNYDTYDESLMDRYLKEGNIYTIKLIRYHGLRFGYRLRFLERSTKDFWFSERSFVYYMGRKFIEKKYCIK